MFVPLWSTLLSLRARRPLLGVAAVAVLVPVGWCDPRAAAMGAGTLLTALLLRVVAPRHGAVAAPVVMAVGALPAVLLPLADATPMALPATMLVVPVALLAGLPTGTRPDGPVPLPDYRRGPAGLRLVAAVLAALAVSLLVWGAPGGWLVIVAVALVSAQTGDACRSVVAIAGATVGAAAVARAVGVEPTPAPGLLAAALPLALAWPPGVRALAPAVLAGLVVSALWLGGWTAGLATAVAGLLAWGLWRGLPDAGGAPWTALPPAWRWFTRLKRRWDPVWPLLLADPRPWGRVLDAGCGSGLGALVAAGRAGTTGWHGVDLDRRKLDVAAHLAARLDVPCQLTAARLPAADIPRADTVLALDILHYWPADEQVALLRWLAAHLAPEGRLWLREGLADAAGAATVAGGERFTTAIGLNPSGPLHFPTDTGLMAACEAAGLTVCQCVPAGAANRLFELAVRA